MVLANACRNGLVLLVNYNTILTDVMELIDGQEIFRCEGVPKGRLLIPRAAFEGGEDVVYCEWLTPLALPLTTQV